MSTWTGTLPGLLAGDIPPASDWDQILDALHALTDSWSTYTPVWTSSGTAPALVNGVIEGRYIQAGKLVLCTGRLNMGSSTTYGTLLYDISLPVAAESGNRYSGSALILDASTAANNQPAACRMDGSNNLRFYGTGGQVSATVPFTWASGDTLAWSVVYAAA